MAGPDDHQNPMTKTFLRKDMYVVVTKPVAPRRRSSR